MSRWISFVLAFSLALLPFVAEAQAPTAPTPPKAVAKAPAPSPKISGLHVSQEPGAWPPEFFLGTLDGPTKTITVRDDATRKILGTSRGDLDCTVENECPVPGVLYGPYDIPAEPATTTLAATPRFWEVVGWLAGGDLTDGQKLRVSINGRKAIVLKCVSETTPWGVTTIECERRP